jgi:hypothetical protein
MPKAAIAPRMFRVLDGVAMQNYEIRLHKADGRYSASCFSAFVSDRDALASARMLLSEGLPSATVWADSRRVGVVARSAPQPLAAA